MNHQSFPEARYIAEISRLTEQLSLLKKKKNSIAWSRFALIILLAAAVYYLYPVGLLYAGIAFVLLSAIFIRLVILAVNNNTAIDNINRLLSINKNELQIAAGGYFEMPDGASFLSPLHPYANDLDIFGKASLYQYTNRTTSQQGNETYADWLQHPADATVILQRQQAVKELGPQLQWRQQLQAFGAEQVITTATQKKINNWVQDADIFSHRGHWKMMRWLYPVITIGILLLYLNNLIPASIFGLAYLIFFLVSGYISKQIATAYNQLNQVVQEISTLSKSAAHIENNAFESPCLDQVRQHFTPGETASSAAIKQLKKILDNFDYNLNFLFLLFINPFILWNLQAIFQLEQWRRNNKTKTAQWFMALGEMEAVSTIASIQFNHPSWAIPVVDEQQHGTFETTALGHPLIAESKCISNDFLTKGNPQVALVTGSNMAGKSTFLRSVGVNTVLAMMGAPVCARQMKLSPMRIISSMRVADNLQESTSTFYAELKKLQSIIESVNNHEKVFVLLDEILRGTNSLDRHTGSKALVKQLIKQKAVAILATHDVELAQLQTDYPDSIHNYHFDAQIANEELFFDYKLKEGICKSINASILMKKIGIEL
ncbi:MAG: MutS family DNA mismatch repair protein [Chitinophagaceae bacterium]